MSGRTCKGLTARKEPCKRTILHGEYCHYHEPKSKYIVNSSLDNLTQYPKIKSPSRPPRIIRVIKRSNNIITTRNERNNQSKEEEDLITTEIKTEERRNEETKKSITPKKTIKQNKMIIPILKKSSTIKKSVNNTPEITGECPICFEDKNVIKLQCEHIVCEDCLKNFDKYLCPICRANFEKTLNNIKVMACIKRNRQKAISQERREQETNDNLMAIMWNFEALMRQYSVDEEDESYTEELPPELCDPFEDFYEEEEEEEDYYYERTTLTLFIN